MKYKDITGQRFGRFIVLGYLGSKPRGAIWNCRCDCGKTKSVFGYQLRIGKIKSCGCLRSELSAIRVTTIAGHSSHGMTDTPEYQAWKSIKARCTRPTNKSFKHYGGRGIKMCDEWLASFQCFLDHVGRRPSRSHSIHRINNDGDYCPGNVKWATALEQSNNQRSTVFVTFQNKTQSLMDWCRELHIKRHAVTNRMYRSGMSAEAALNEARYRACLGRGELR